MTSQTNAATQETLRSEDHFGLLVITLPVAHDGGDLVICSKRKDKVR